MLMKEAKMKTLDYLMKISLMQLSVG